MSCSSAPGAISILCTYHPAALGAASPEPGCVACVVIPARDEAATLGATLDALAAQRDRAGQPLDPASYEVIVLANNCADDTAAVARACGARRPALRLRVIELALPEERAHVGWARRLAMDEALRRLTSPGRPRGGVIATTDADTRPDATWLAETLAEVAAGADAVAGRIALDRASLAALDPLARAYHLRDLGYRQLLTEIEAYLDPDPADPWPRHCQHSGASLAVTVAAYARAGGLPPEPWLEDIAFYDALRSVDARLRHSPSVRVVTSARPRGRTGFGFAVQLRQFAAMGRARQPFLVEPPDAFAARVALRADLRAAWRHGRVAPGLARRLGVDASWLAAALSATPTFGALWEAVEARRAPDPRRIEISGAIAQARRTLAALRSGTSAGGPRPLVEVEPVELLTPAD